MPSLQAATTTRDAEGSDLKSGAIPLLRMNVSETSSGYAFEMTTSTSPGGGAE